MSELKIELCPETGICSLIKPGEGKADLLPFEVAAINAAAGDQEKIKAIIAESNSDFAEKLNAAELSQVISELK